MTVLMDAARLEELNEWTEVGPWRVEYCGQPWVLWSDNHSLVMVPEGACPGIEAKPYESNNLRDTLHLLHPLEMSVAFDALRAFVRPRAFAADKEGPEYMDSIIEPVELLGVVLNGRLLHRALELVPGAYRVRVAVAGATDSMEVKGDNWRVLVMPIRYTIEDARRWRDA